MIDELKARAVIRLNAWKHNVLYLFLSAFLLFMSGCESRPSLSDAALPDEIFTVGKGQTAPPLDTAEASEPPLGGGTIIYAKGAAPLEKEQEQLLLDYMNLYYTSLARLDPCDPTPLFARDASEQADRNRLIWDVIIGIRSMQKADLSLCAYNFTLTVQSVAEREDGNIVVRAAEDFTQNFTAYPDIDSKGFNIRHTFTLTQTVSGRRIAQHRQSDSLNNSLMGNRQTVDNGEEETNLFERRDRLLEQAAASAAGRALQGTVPEKTTADNPYDRAAAVEYARKWVGRRNPAWNSYDGLGGNCQNFTSQAIFAGGIPMDYKAPAQWKWYGDTPNEKYQPTGRAPAWTTVQPFLTYVKSNFGYGMAAVADAPYYTGEPGDVIHLGADGSFRHTVIITQVMRGEDGSVTDYLIASNTSDLLDFPVSAFYYQEQMLIKIFGWNNG